MAAVIPSQEFEVVLDTGEAGIAAELGTTILDNIGGTSQAYNAAGIIEIAPGVYSAVRVAPGTVGQYSIVWRRGSAVDDDTVGVEDLIVGGSASSASVPVGDDEWVHGPCSLWITGTDVADCCDADVGSETDLLDDVAEMASFLLYDLSGRRFNGICQRTVRPCRNLCGCWDGELYLGASCDAPTCGCNTESRIRLDGYPVREIVSVKIDGEVIDEDTYRLDENRYLLRLHDAGPPVVPQTWPGCQNIALDDDHEGTFSITYTYGVAPPALARRAAAQLACELLKACPGTAGECALPNKVTRVVRQGVTIEKIIPLAELLKEGATGLQIVDAFLAAVSKGPKRRPAVWSPDVQPHPRVG